MHQSYSLVPRLSLPPPPQAIHLSACNIESLRAESLPEMELDIGPSLASYYEEQLIFLILK